ncbi:ABC transporter substrate-binding protein [Macrococcus lamae]|uniref:ABC transporter substrate-binding protein n=1 Tax=Macrococcus lamae TaxID=198484 RepID=A0A4R6BUH9_9STAP|nr:ABC transporter substrate-binding protein [Macrococcus lamae]TDM11970.1 ABC transporter substrate-binding protein [Macrococcus lamae]
MKRILLITLLLLAGCQQSTEKQSHDKTMRIISLMPSNTEILYELGLDNEIIGVSTADDYPEDVATKARFDGFNLNKEVLLKAQPTLIVAHQSAQAAQNKILSDLQQQGIEVLYVTDATRLSEIDDTIRQIAAAAGRTEEGETLSAAVNKQIDDVITNYPDARHNNVFLEVSSEPEIYTGGSGTLYDDMLTKLGSTNVFHEVQGWQPVSKEAIVRTDPDVMITTSGQSEEDYNKTVMNRGGFKEVTAVRDSRIYALNADWISRPGPRIAKGLEALAKILSDK